MTHTHTHKASTATLTAYLCRGLMKGKFREFGKVKVNIENQLSNSGLTSSMCCMVVVTRRRTFSLILRSPWGVTSLLLSF